MPGFSQKMQKNCVSAAIWKVVFPYVVFASLWIFVSDSIVALIWHDPAQIVEVGTLKGWVFVTVTAFLLSVLLRRLIVRQNLVETNLREKHVEMERFIYTVSHDLKSPLITVNTFLGYLEQDLASNDSSRIQQDLTYVRTATEKMEKMLGELLEMSRIGRVVNPPTLVTFRELAAEAIDAVAGAIVSQGVNVTLSGENVTFYGDRPRLVEIWQNLLENSVKYMGGQTDPRIEIGAEQCGTETVFFVRDNGIGLDPGDYEKIFGLFVKLDPQSEGTGLGLGLTKRIVEIYQGNIWVESAGAGKGCKFCFTLPGALKNSVE